MAGVDVNTLRSDVAFPDDDTLSAFFGRRSASAGPAFSVLEGAGVKVPTYGDVEFVKLVTPHPLLNAYRMARSSKAFALTVAGCLSFSGLLILVFAQYVVKDAYWDHIVRILSYSFVALSVESRSVAGLFYRKQRKVEAHVNVVGETLNRAAYDTARESAFFSFFSSFVLNVLAFAIIAVAVIQGVQTDLFLPACYTTVAIAVVCDLAGLLFYVKQKEAAGRSTIEALIEGTPYVETVDPSAIDNTCGSFQYLVVEEDDRLSSLEIRSGSHMAT